MGMVPNSPSRKLHFEGLVGCAAMFNNEDVIIASEPFINNSDYAYVVIIKQDKSLDTVSIHQLKLKHQYL